MLQPDPKGDKRGRSRVRGVARWSLGSPRL